MAKMVGLSRNIKLPWLNKVVELINEGLDEEEIKRQLNEYLSFEIPSPTNARKTREILMNVWVYENEYRPALKEEALKLIKAYPEYDLPIHWCMLLAAYPIFDDMCKLIGKMSEFQDEIPLAQIRQKIFDEWGERTTLFHSIDKLMATLKALDAVKNDRPGRYHIEKHLVKNEDVVLLMVYTMMAVDGAGYYSLQELSSSNYLFPFEYELAKEMLLQDERFILSTFDSTLSVTLKER